MAYVVNLVVTAKPEEFDNLVAYMAEILPVTAKYDGAQVITCYTNPDEHMLTVHEIWESKDHPCPTSSQKITTIRSWNLIAGSLPLRALIVLPIKSTLPFTRHGE